MTNIRFRLKDAAERRVDSKLTIRDLFSEPGFAFDFVVAKLSGDHPTVVNRASDRVYYILSGSGTAAVDGKRVSLERGDLVRIPRGTPHTISGKLEYIIVTSPPFSPDNESVV